MAVCAVLVHHFLPVKRVLPEDFLTLGLLAVRLFFVLSGYLITGILLRSRKLTFRAALKQFYVRRALRIFPIYYITLFLLTMIGIPSVRTYIFWHAVYLSNLAFILTPAGDGPAGHLWTLSVEEQFYFAWPFLILRTKYKNLLKIILGAVILGLCWKTFVAFRIGAQLAGAILTPACLDSLGLGGLLAFIEHDDALKLRKEEFLRASAIIGGIIVLLQTGSYLTSSGLRLFWSTSYLGVSLVFVWVVGRASEGFSGKLGTLLEWHPIVYVGKISYGIYLYHNFMPGLTRYLVNILGLRQPGTMLTFLSATGLTFLIAVASWHLIEKPISRWKDSLSYGPESHRCPSNDAM